MNIIYPNALIDAQKKASDPKHSVWVSAHAGSGKTKVLTDRVVRLMLSGTPPAAILCLTYTKAAATNMSARVYSILGRFAILSDADLRQELENLGIEKPNLNAARQLFSRALETPGGLKVQTIHAFCEKILHQFPFEANVSADFEIITDEIKEEMLLQARETMLQRAPQDLNLQAALTTLAGLMADQTLDALLQTLMEKRAMLEAWLEKSPSDAALQADLEQLLGAEKLETLEAELIHQKYFQREDIAVLRAIRNEKKDKDFIDNLEYALKTQEPYAYLQCFYRKGLTEPLKHPLTKAFKDTAPALYEAIETELSRLPPLFDSIKQAKTRDATLALVRVGKEILAAYQATKAARACLDFEDLILKTQELFNRVAATWVLYKLDSGIDHILVDEAQDTSPAQWALIAKLVESFTGGLSARQSKRTLFVVGDEKQSIFSFQGADPTKFDEMRVHFQQEFQASQLDFEKVPLKYSFRSSQTLLDFVDEVAKNPNVQAGLTAQPMNETHLAANDFAGLVELWEKPDKEPLSKSEDWLSPLDNPSNATLALAARIAKQIKHWLSQGLQLPARETPVQAGDILILLRKRNKLFHAIIAALKTEDVPVAGADRLKLTQHIAVHDLCALVDALLNPHEDYALACVLKSPIFGLSEEEIFTLCVGREGTLRGQLKDTRIATQLEAWQKEAYALKPSLFFATLLGRDGLRAKFIARLGPETQEVLAEFLTQIETLSASHHGDLRAIVTALRAHERELKRDMEQVGQAVRVMTVHGAKGLEADIVFMADTSSNSKGGQNTPKIYEMNEKTLVWSPSAADEPLLVRHAKAELKSRETQEAQRLLYVAMTRAARRLVICALPSNDKETWHTAIEAAMTGGVESDALMREVLGQTAPYQLFLCPLTKEPIKRWFKGAGQGEAYEDKYVLTPPCGTQTLILPTFLTQKTTFSSPLVYEKEEPSDERQAAIARGIRIHQKLEQLIGKPLENCDAEIAPIVSRLLTHPLGALLFASHALAEVPLVGFGRINQVDRLIPQGEMLYVADFKTTPNVPKTENHIPQNTKAQIKGYVALLAAAFPHMKIVPLVVYTDNGTIFEI